MQARLGKIELIALVAFLMSLNALAIDIMLPALPAMGIELGVSEENHRQFVLSAYLIGFGIAQLFYGPISDRFGRRTPLMAGLAIYVVAAAAATIAPNFESLLALRFIQGMGAASTRIIAQATVRDRFEGRAMAEVMSLVFMTFMIVPVLAPGMGQVLLFFGNWHIIFLFMAGLATLVALWAYVRLDESLPEDRRRPLSARSVIEGFGIVVSSRTAFFYGLSSMFVMGSLFGFINTATQIYVEIFKLGNWFPVAFGAVASLMAVSSFLNSRLVTRIGMRRLAHGALIAFTLISGLWLVLAEMELATFWPFMILFTLIMFSFGMVGSNTQALAMEPLGALAGTASSVFGFLQTVGGALMGALIGLLYDGTLVPIAAGYCGLGATAILCVLIAENGKLFGVGAAYRK